MAGKNLRLKGRKSEKFALSCCHVTCGLRESISISSNGLAASGEIGDNNRKILRVLAFVSLIQRENFTDVHVGEALS